MTIAAVVLAAGESSRFGSPKQRLLLPEVLRHLQESSVDGVVVVQGAHDLVLPSDAASRDVPMRLVHCRDWERGPGATLRCGLEALDVQVEVAVVVLADGPDLSPHAIERVLAVARRERRIVAASYDGQRGHPLVLPRELWGDVPDEGLQGWPVRLVPCDDLGAPGDVDEPADLPLRLRG